MSFQYSRFVQLPVYFCIMLLTAGCVIHDLSDLDIYTQDILARPGGRIEPIPEIKPYEAYAYQSAAEGLRDPFHVFFQKTQKDIEETQDTGLTQEMENEIKNRNREELEGFELDSLRMVGTLDDADNNWGIILDPDGSVHRVKVGNYLGTNIGKILNIFEDKIELREIVKDSQGKWEDDRSCCRFVHGGGLCLNTGIVPEVIMPGVKIQWVG